MSAKAKDLLPDFCLVMSEALAELVLQLSPSVTQRDILELPLLTLGSRFQGSNNNTIGREVAVEVFLSISEIVTSNVIERTGRSLALENSSGRKVFVVLGADPDVSISEEFGEELRKRVALEIKGGTDRSNAHNRVGEAEKSHIKARASGFRDFWTVIAKKGLDLEKLMRESPTTNSWFDTAQIVGRSGPDWEDFKSRLIGEVGISSSDEGLVP